MDATCAIQASIHVFSLVRKYVSRILGTYQNGFRGFLRLPTDARQSTIGKECKNMQKQREWAKNRVQADFACFDKGKKRRQKNDI